MRNIDQEIRGFLEENFLFEFDEELRSDTDLFKAGVVDSFGYIQLLKFLESHFGVEYSEEEIVSNVLVSLDGIVDSVNQKLSSGGIAGTG